MRVAEVEGEADLVSDLDAVWPAPGSGGVGQDFAAYPLCETTSVRHSIGGADDAGAKGAFRRAGW